METMTEGTPHVTIEEAARELGTTHLRVLMLLKHRVLSGSQVAGAWYVERTSLDTLKEDGLPGMEPAGCRASCTASSCGCNG